MREIKFRGLSTVSGEWIYGDLIQRTTDFIFPAGVYTTKIYEYLVEIRPETKGQFTGLRDEDGTEIYEGDIVEVDGGKSVIESAPGGFTVASLPLVEVSNYGMKVIGNIYEHPELLECDGE